jgi:hypothetical protein
MSDDDDKIEIVNITPQGRAALRKDQPQGMELLILEVMSRTADVTVDHILDLVDQLVDHYGAPEPAIEALRAGKVKLQKK